MRSTGSVCISPQRRWRFRALWREAACAPRMLYLALSESESRRVQVACLIAAKMQTTRTLVICSRQVVFPHRK